MLLYISGSYPNNQEGIAAGAKVLFDEFYKIDSSICLLTTNLDIVHQCTDKEINKTIFYLDNWKNSKTNVKKLYKILIDKNITEIHMEYPGDLYGKTFFASFIPYHIKKYNKKYKKNIHVFVRLHEFTMARFLRKLAILPILKYADKIYVPGENDLKTVTKFAKGRTSTVLIGTNIYVENNVDYFNVKKPAKISYFGSVYPGKGFERMLDVWKQVKNKYGEQVCFEIIGDVGINDDNHFKEYHKSILEYIDRLGMKDTINITGYLSDSDVSKKISESYIATVLYEDGLTLRRGSFLAYLSHGCMIVTTNGDSSSHKIFDNHKGVSMCNDNNEIYDAIDRYLCLEQTKLVEYSKDNQELAKQFSWNSIASKMLKDYKSYK